MSDQKVQFENIFFSVKNYSICTNNDVIQYCLWYVLFTDTNNKIIVKTYLLRLVSGVDDTKCQKYKLRPLIIHCNA